LIKEIANNWTRSDLQFLKLAQIKLNQNEKDFQNLPQLRARQTFSKGMKRKSWNKIHLTRKIPKSQYLRLTKFIVQEKALDK
jgi:hypothetical protein